MQVNQTPKPDEAKSFQKRDRLLEIEAKAQALWESEGAHNKEVDPSRPKYFVNFPYPYMNGRLHLGHAFSMSKPEFYARFKSLKGFNVLFPFGYHCTGMPISAASLKLKEELTSKYSKEGLAALLALRQKEGLKSFEHTPMTQYEIMLSNHVAEEELPRFFEAEHWLRYFPPKGQEDLRRFGAAVDHRRSFITTSANPFYDSFVRWQFRKLEQRGFLKFGQRPSIFSEKDGQMCADHDRAEGEGVLPQEYTLVKLRVLETRAEALRALLQAGRTVVLPAATLRPETMYGQTNCFVQPDVEYGVFEMASGEVWVTSDHAMRNLSFQGKTKERGRACQLGRVRGAELIGSAVKAPLSHYPIVFVWPMLGISMAKGTGIVTSVPSDAPDDYAVMVELRKKKAFREKFGLADEQVLPFEPVPIIETKKYQTLAAVKAFEQFKVTSMNDAENLKRAKDDVYLDGFYTGVVVVGEFKGRRVAEAKPLIRALLLGSGEAEAYFEPESQCVSRSGDVCVVALCDQWYITYGTEEARERLKAHVRSPQFNSFNETIKGEFLAALDWLRDWGCSRTFGLGTRLPCDPQFLIESLSDSTVYMAYYTVCHLLHADLEGLQPGRFGARAEDFAEADWDCVFLKHPRRPESRVPPELLAEMRASFEYWYPFDLRCSGKDLIKNHLTMSLYNHEFVWGAEGLDYLPRGFFCNGWVLVDGEKMSKSKGNFLLLGDLCRDHSADCVRLALANAGDTLSDANLEVSAVDSLILRLASLEHWLQDLKRHFDLLREESDPEVEFHDRVFENKLRETVLRVEAAYERLLFRDVMREGFFGLVHLKDEYKHNCGGKGVRKDLIRLYVEWQLLLLFPVAPHFAEVMWTEVLLALKVPGDTRALASRASTASFPAVTASQIDFAVLKELEYLHRVGSSLRRSCEKILKKKPGTRFAKVVFVVAAGYFDWQTDILKYLQTLQFDPATKEPLVDWRKEVKGLLKDPKNSQKAFKFASFKMEEFAELGPDCFSHEVALDEAQSIKRHLDIILKDSVEADEIVVVGVEEALKSADKNLSQNAENSKPGSPVIAFEFK